MNHPVHPLYIPHSYRLYAQTMSRSGPAQKMIKCSVAVDRAAHPPVPLVTVRSGTPKNFSAFCKLAVGDCVPSLCPALFLGVFLCASIVTAG